MLFHWLKQYGKGRQLATHEIATRVDEIFTTAIAASPAVFAKPSKLKANRTAKLEHLAPFVAAATLKTDALATRAILEEFFDRLDIGLREAGVGEMKVGVEIRTMAAALNGRIQRYQPFMEAKNWPELGNALSEHGVDPSVLQNLQKTLA